LISTFNLIGMGGVVSELNLKIRVLLFDFYLILGSPTKDSTFLRLSMVLLIGPGFFWTRSISSEYLEWDKR